MKRIPFPLLHPIWKSIALGISVAISLVLLFGTFFPTIMIWEPSILLLILAILFFIMISSSEKQETDEIQHFRSSTAFYTLIISLSMLLGFLITHYLSGVTIETEGILAATLFIEMIYLVIFYFQVWRFVNVELNNGLISALRKNRLFYLMYFLIIIAVLCIVFLSGQSTNH